MNGESLRTFLHMNIRKLHTEMPLFDHQSCVIEMNKTHKELTVNPAISICVGLQNFISRNFDVILLFKMADVRHVGFVVL